MKRIFSRGLNYHGQCGLGKEIRYSIEKFSEVDVCFPIKNVYANLAHSIAIHEDMKTVLFWGFNWDIRSFLRTTAIFQLAPNFMSAVKSFWPPLKSFPHTPCILNKFPNKIIDISLGGGHCLFLDEQGICYGVGDNTSGQLEFPELEPIFLPLKINLNEEMKFIKISAGFQHSLFLNTKGEVYGCGKCDKMQLGKEYLTKFHNFPSVRDQGIGMSRLNLSSLDGNVVDIAAGKYHSSFLTDKGSVYTIGVNRFGQLGESNLNKTISSEPIKLEFPSDIKIIALKVGDNHNLMLGDDGILYANGDNSSGQIDGDLDNFMYYNCTPKRVPIPNDSPIINFYAKNNRSAALLQNGKFYYWGGYSYHIDYVINNQPKYDGFNVFNSEQGLPDLKIVDVGLGYFHDILLLE